VDLLITVGRHVFPIEIKLGGAIGLREVTGLRNCMEDLRLRRGYVVSSGSERRSIGQTIEIIPWSDVASGKFEFPKPR
jgi:predicted AAA+ superfamily ATPase